MPFCPGVRLFFRRPSGGIGLACQCRDLLATQLLQSFPPKIGFSSDQLKAWRAVLWPGPTLS